MPVSCLPIREAREATRTDLDDIFVLTLIMGTIHTLFFFRTHTISSARTCICAKDARESGRTEASEEEGGAIRGRTYVKVFLRLSAEKE